MICFYSISKYISLALGVAICAFVFVTGVSAEQRELKTDAADKVDAILVMDASGSMIVNDPKRLRDEGARLFAQFLKQGDRLGIIQFAESATVVRPLSPFTLDQSPDVSKAVASIGTEGQYTDLLAGIDSAKSMLEGSRREEARPVVVLLSDGKMEPDPRKGTAEAFTEKLLGEMLPRMKDEGIRVYTLAFSEDADKVLLGRIAEVTDGVNWFAPVAEKIHESFADLFLSIKKPQVVVLDAKGFTVDKDVQEATFYINRGDGPEIEIFPPKSPKISASSVGPNVRWFKGQNFDVVTVLSPEPGNWKVRGISNQDSFATLLTNLKLVADWPSLLNIGEKTVLQARMYESSLPVSLPEMSGVTKYAFQITPTDRVSEPIMKEFLYDDGTHGDKLAGDGIFSAAIELEEPGDYRLMVLSKSPTFERRVQIPFKIKPPIIMLQVIAGSEAVVQNGEGHTAEGTEAKPGVDEKQPEDAHGAGHQEKPHGVAETEGAEQQNGATGVVRGDPLSVFQAVLSDEGRLFKNVSVTIVALNKERTRYLLPVTRTGIEGLQFEASAGTLPRDGWYQVLATVNAEARGARRIKEDSNRIEFTRITAGQEVVVQEAVVVEKPVTKEPSKPGFPWGWLILTNIIVAGAGVGTYLKLVKAQGQSITNVTKNDLPGEILTAIEALEKKAVLTEMDLNDPSLTDEATISETPPPAAQPAPSAQPPPAQG